MIDGELHITTLFVFYLWLWTSFANIETQFTLACLEIFQLFVRIVGLSFQFRWVGNFFNQKEETLYTILLFVKRAKQVTSILHIGYFGKINLAYWHVSVFEIQKPE